jgi:hypothetical protein
MVPAYNFYMDTEINSLEELIGKSEFASIATVWMDRPHMVATWSEFITVIDKEDKKFLAIPAGGYSHTEENLKENANIQILFGSKDLEGKSGKGSGFRISGKGEVVNSGDIYDLVKSKFSWARGALVISVGKVEQLL